MTNPTGSSPNPGYYPPQPPQMPHRQPYYSTTPLPPHLTDTGAVSLHRTVGTGLLWTTLLLTIPYTFSAFSQGWEAITLATLLLPIASLIFSGMDVGRHLIPGKGHLLALTLLPAILVFILTVKAGINLSNPSLDLGYLTTFMGYGIFGLLLTALIMLGRVAKHFPHEVKRPERIGSNAVLCFFIGSTAATTVMPLLYFMGMFALVGGKYTVIAFSLPFILLVVGTVAFLTIRHFSDRKNTLIQVPGPLFRMRNVLPWSILVFGLTFIIAAAAVFALMSDRFGSM